MQLDSLSQLLSRGPNLTKLILLAGSIHLVHTDGPMTLTIRVSHCAVIRNVQSTVMKHPHLKTFLKRLCIYIYNIYLRMS